MKRLLPTLIVLALLLCTVAAFAFTERAKLAKSPLAKLQIDRQFSPTCNCPTDRARIVLRLAKADRMSLSVVDDRHRAVRMLVDNRLTRGLRRYTWDGRDTDGAIVRDGTYSIRIQLADLDRTFFPPQKIDVDTVAPRVTVGAVRPRVFSPDGDRRADGVAVDYRVNEPARAFLLVNGKPRVVARFRVSGGTLHWYGKVHGRSFPAGTYRLAVDAKDLAGNLSAPVRAGTVLIRYIHIVDRTIHVPAGKRAAVYVATDAAAFRWRIGAHSGVNRGRLLRLPALKRGVYRLLVVANRHRDTARVVVGKRR